MIVKAVNLEITTHCNRRCENCCSGIGRRPARHHNWKYFVDSARWLYGIPEVNVTGGEPTMHPDFGGFSIMFRRLFGCRHLRLQTNGYGVTGHLGIIQRNYDEVAFTDYHDAPDAAELARDLHWSVFDAGENAGAHLPLAAVGGGQPCYRAFERSGRIAYADGRIFGCCVAPGIPDAMSVSPSPEWRDLVLPPPCERCCFSEGQ